MSPAPLTLSVLPALHLPEPHQETQHRSWRALQCKWFLFHTSLSFCVSRIPQSPSKQHWGGNTSCKQQLLNTRKALFSTVTFAIVSKNLSSTEGIYEQQSCTNYLPSSTDYIQAFLFIKMQFSLSHSFIFKMHMGPFLFLNVPGLQQNCPTASKKKTHAVPTPVPFVKNLLMREHLIPSLEEKIKPQETILSAQAFQIWTRAVLPKKTHSQQSPGTQPQLSVVFTVPSRSPATPACTKSDSLLMLLIQYSFQSSPCCTEQGTQRSVPMAHTHTHRAQGQCCWAKPTSQGHKADKSSRRTQDSHPPTATCTSLGTASKKQGTEAKPRGQQVPHCVEFPCLSPSPWEPWQLQALWTALSTSNSLSKNVSNRSKPQVELVESHSTWRTSSTEV